MPSETSPPPLPEFDEIVRRLARHRARTIPGWLARRRAAVAVILRPGPTEGTEVLLVRRSKRVGDPWSGDMAFPGGLATKSDADLRATAERETSEELGVDLAGTSAFVGTLSDQPTLGRDRRPLAIRPFVFRTDRDETAELPLVPNREIASAHWIDLAAFRRETHHTTVSRRFLGIPITFACYRIDEHVVWGLTLRMVLELVRAVA